MRCACVQSDIVHQSVMELIHSEDRDQFKMQLNWRSALSQDAADLSLDQAMQPGQSITAGANRVSSAVAPC